MVTHGKEEICTLFGRRGRISIFYTDKEGLAAKVIHVLVEPVILNRTVFSREAVLGQTSSSISCATMKCFAFFLLVSLATFMNLTITDKSSKKCSASTSFFCVTTIKSVYPGGWGDRWSGSMTWCSQWWGLQLVWWEVGWLSACWGWRRTWWSAEEPLVGVPSSWTWRRVTPTDFTQRWRRSACPLSTSL